MHGQFKNSAAIKSVYSDKVVSDEHLFDFLDVVKTFAQSYGIPIYKRDAMALILLGHYLHHEACISTSIDNPLEKLTALLTDNNYQPEKDHFINKNDVGFYIGLAEFIEKEMLKYDQFVFYGQTLYAPANDVLINLKP